MIGIVGPADSVALALEVAETEGVGREVVGRPYRTLDEVIATTRELDRVCRVVLFTGRIPHAMALSAGGWNAALDYVSHSGVDLYRSLVRALIDRGGVLPRSSIDTITPDEVSQAFSDLELPIPSEVLPLETIGADQQILGVEEMLAFHLDAHASGRTDVAFTCVGLVFDQLRESQVPCYRVAHTRSVMRDAIRRVTLASHLARSESTQPAVVLVDVSAPAGANSRMSVNEAQLLRLRIHESMVEFAESLHGTLSPLDDRRFIVHTTRGVVEEGMRRRERGQLSNLEPRGIEPRPRVGCGLGYTVARAEANARRALARSQGSGHFHIISVDGQELSAGSEVTPKRRSLVARSRVPDEPLAIGPVAFERLVNALQRLDTNHVTAQGLAEAHRLEARSARRLLAQLERAQALQYSHEELVGGRGRPRKVYTLDFDRLAELAVSFEEGREG